MIKPFGACEVKTSIDAFTGKSDSPSPFAVFVKIYGELPNVKTARDINIEQFQERLLARYEGRISFLRTMDSIQGQRGYFSESGWWLGMDGVLVVSDGETEELHFLYLSAVQSLVVELEDLARENRLRRKRTQPLVHIVTSGAYGLHIVPMAINRPKLDLSQHYNEDFRDVDEIIQKRLNRKNDKGIVLLHGLPGTGKTTYLRYLISNVKKKVIFIPPGYAERLTDPAFMALLMDHPNSVLVIEDAERVLADRDRMGHSAVSVLLNLSDGLLSDCLNMQLICTFNTHLSRIDQALLRQGRLIARYCFRELEAEKAGALLVAQGKAFEEARPMTLAEVYGAAHPSIQEPFQAKDGIGFRVQKAG